MNNTENYDNVPVLKIEHDLKLHLIYQLQHNLTKWAELVKMARSSQLGAFWTGGTYNDAEELAAAAVAEAYGLADALDTDYNASVRTIANFVGMPYKRLLTFFAKYFILSNADPKGYYCTYVPYDKMKL